MKNLFGIIGTIILLAVNVTSANVPTNANVNTNVNTNNTTSLQIAVNETVIDILRGAKSASSEIYQASKSAVVASVDFAKQQVPDVVDQFIKWKLTESIVYTFGWSIIIGFLIYVSRKFDNHCTQYEKNHPDIFADTYVVTPPSYDFALGSKWFIRIAAIIMIAVNIWINGMTIAKILVAPKVYLIEYVADVIQESQRYHRN